ncbi:MAG: sigma-70 family RNA polymerase sigma factor [Clostridia bacterium]|nr:sigma-70 family RNA polymerase sigma factor [Clostridia bacterium]
MDNGASSYRRFLDGDEGAFEEIMLGYRDGLTFFIDGFVHDTMVAEDIAIDVFTYLLVNPKKYDFSVSLKTYLYMLGRSRALDHLRYRKRRSTVDISAADADAADRDSLEAEILADERSRLINRALEKLPEKMRTAVYLIFFEGLSYEETARVMRLNRKQVDNLLYRAKGQLRLIIGEEGVLWI